MAAVAGKGGTVTYAGGNVATLKEWSLDISPDMHDVTSFTTAAPTWKEFIAGLNSWTGSLTGTLDPASTGQNNLITDSLAPVSAAVILEKDQTNGGKYSGNALISGASVGVVIDGLVDMGWDLQGTGALTYTTTT